MKKKILFFDVDGTLLDEKTRTIPTSTKESIKKLKENGHLVFLNTGRPSSTLEDELIALDFDGYVCGCGTYISYGDKVLENQPIPYDECKKIVENLRKYNIDGVLEGTKGVYIDDKMTHPSIIGLKENYTAQNYKIYNFDDEDISFDKFAGWCNPTTNLEEYIKTLDNFDVIYRDNKGEFIEVIPKGKSKATGIKYLLDYFNMDLDDAYVFGDSTNDTPMLEYASNAIVMGNGDPSIFELASFITKPVDEDGIEHALKHFNLI